MTITGLPRPIQQSLVVALSKNNQRFIFWSPSWRPNQHNLFLPKTWEAIQCK